MNANVSPAAAAARRRSHLVPVDPRPLVRRHVDARTSACRSGCTTSARSHIDSELPDVKSIVGFGWTFPPPFAVVSRSHCDVEPFGTNVHRAASDWLPVCAIVLTSVELIPVLMFASVVLEKIGSRNIALLLVSVVVNPSLVSNPVTVMGVPPTVLTMSSTRRLISPPTFPPLLRMRMCSNAPSSSPMTARRCPR